MPETKGKSGKCMCSGHAQWVGFGCLAVMLAIGSGCRHCAGTRAAQSATLTEYLNFVRESAMADTPTEILLSKSGFSWEVASSYETVYADEKYVSFVANEFCYRGGAHGGKQITVGTIDRKTGRRMKVRDFVSANQLPRLAKILKTRAAQQVGGADKLQGEVKVIENFYYTKGKLHFVYNEYEIACYAAGAVEVEVPLKDLNVR